MVFAGSAGNVLIGVFMLIWDGVSMSKTTKFQNDREVRVAQLMEYFRRELITPEELAYAAYDRGVMDGK